VILLKKLNVGIIGLGHMGLLHFMNCYKLNYVNVVAVADKSKRALNKANNRGVKHQYKDYREMLSERLDLDAVIISLPNFLHFDSILLALESGINVFVEKPMANTVDECQKISKNVKKSGRKLMVGHNYRYYDHIEKMKETLDVGKLGKLEVFTSELVINGPFSHPAVPKPVPEWWFDPGKTGGGVVHDLGYHLIDLFRFFQGEAKVLYSNLDHKMNFPMEDGAIIVLQALDSETKGILNMGWYQKTIFPRFNFRTILHGDSGYLSSSELIPRNLYMHAAKIGIKNFLKKISGQTITPLSYTYYYDSYYKILDHFLSCIKEDADTDITVEDGLKTVKLIKEVYDNSHIKGDY